MRKGISMGKGRLMITNGNIVTEDGVIKGDILVDNGKIVGIASSITTEAVRINANGMFVFPGFIDRARGRLFSEGRPQFWTLRLRRAI